jgi:hypothetical protein
VSFLRHEGGELMSISTDAFQWITLALLVVIIVLLARKW